MMAMMTWMAVGDDDDDGDVDNEDDGGEDLFFCWPLVLGTAYPVHPPMREPFNCFLWLIYSNGLGTSNANTG
jgi:hypothetical protein